MTERWRAGHLPGVAEADIEWRTLRFEGGPGAALEVEVPWLAPDRLRALARQVRANARATLAPMPVSEVIAALDQAVARLLDARHPLRRQADELLPRVTGFDAQMVKAGLTGYLQAFRAPQLHRFVAEDFPNPKVLDEFQPAAKGGAVRALGPGLVAHHWAGNVPGLPLWSLASALLVKSASLGKLPSAEPVFATLFARALAEVHSPLADCVVIAWWKGGDGEAAQAAHAEAGAVLAYGGSDTVARVRETVPAATRFLGFGHKLGLALVGRCALDARRGAQAARALAHDVARWDQQGCYSPHVVYVERGGRMTPRDFAQELAGELSALALRYPRRALSLEESAAVASWRQRAEFAALSDDGDELLGDEAAPWAVAYADRWQPLQPTAGQRCVQVVSVESLEDAADALAPQAAFLQTVGLAVSPARLYPLSERLAVAGATRIGPLGSMAAPEAGWHHDGGCNLRDLVRWVEIEAAAERAADRLAPYAQEDRP